MLIGIDPGLSGAIALYDETTGKLVDVWDMPVHALARGSKAKREVDVTELARLIDAAGPIDHAFIEAVGAMPGNGSSSMFAFGKAFGLAIGVIGANFVPMTLVPPARWKKALGVPAAKDGARARASQLMPGEAGRWSRAKDDGRAEAALLALYGSRMFGKVAA